MTPEDRKQVKRKVLEGLGCLLYVLAAALLAGVFLARCGEVFR